MERIVNFTNTTDEDFVGMYHGEDFPVKAGETKTLIERVAKHIAGQLATHILIGKKVRNYLTDVQREPLIKEMLGALEVPQEKEVLPDEEPEEKEEEEKEFEDLPKKVKKPRKKAKK